VGMSSAACTVKIATTEGVAGSWLHVAARSSAIDAADLTETWR
jgi:hypothetical protein